VCVCVCVCGGPRCKLRYGTRARFAYRKSIHLSPPPHAGTCRTLCAYVRAVRCMQSKLQRAGRSVIPVSKEEWKATLSTYYSSRYLLTYSSRHTSSFRPRLPRDETMRDQSRSVR
jgi:hypothetical protein